MRCFASKHATLTRSQEGVAAVEFAIVAPVLFLIVFGIIEFSLIQLAANVMESATTISSRLGRIGYSEEATSREETILNSITDHAGVLLDPSRIVITSRAYQSYDAVHEPEPYIDANGNHVYDRGEEDYTDVNGNGQWDADMGAAGYGVAGDIVVYTITYPWPLMTPGVHHLIGDANGNFVITAHAVVKNEPFDH